MKRMLGLLLTALSLGFFTGCGEDIVPITASVKSDKSTYNAGETIKLTAETSASDVVFYWKEGGDADDHDNGWTEGSSTKTYTKSPSSKTNFTFHVMVWTSAMTKTASVTVAVNGTGGTTVTWDGVGEVHTGITASTFWVGEHGSDDNFNISNVGSAWDSHWGDNFGLEDAPNISRDGEFIPTSGSFKKKENPFYFALPYNDYDNVAYDGSDCNAVVGKSSSFKKVYDADYGRDIVTTSAMSGSRKSSTSKIPWKSDENWSGKSMVKARWIKISWGGKTCYAQWGDAGPYYYDDYDYVFGSAEPMNQQVAKDSPNAGIDLSPSVMLYLGVKMWPTGAEAKDVSWQFVSADKVPDGPWKKHISTNATNW